VHRARRFQPQPQFGEIVQRPLVEVEH
jgi:hypothetical protein